MKERKMIAGKILLILAAAAFAAYGYTIQSVRSGSRFYIVWYALAVCCFLVFAGWQTGAWEWLSQHCPKPVKIGFWGILGAAVLLFLVVEGCIIHGFATTDQTNLDYVVVLGAQMRANGPSLILRYRLDVAAAYLEENPDTKCIVSGGKGVNETVSEASGMAAYLIAKGIDKKRIYLEDQSKNTIQNIRNSKNYLDPEKDRVGIVSSNFHLYRGVQIAKKQGYRHVYGISAATPRAYLINNMVREFFGVLKDSLYGNMRVGI